MRITENKLKLLLIPLFGGALLVALGFQTIGVTIGAGSLVGFMVLGELAREK